VEQEHDHPHAIAHTADRKWLRIALGLILAFMAAEVAVGFIAHSVALLSDAAHMLTDAMALVLALFAMHLATREPSGGFTFGLRRAEILSAQANGISLVLLALFLAYESIKRLVHPPPTAGGLVLVTAVVGIAVNLAATWCVGRANRASLNIEGAFQHLLGDLFAFVATAIAGLIIVLTGETRADPIASLAVVALMIKAGVRLVKESGRIFMEAAPAGMSPRDVGHAMVDVPGVVEVHDLHLWQVTSGYPTLSAHVFVAPAGDCHAVRGHLEGLLKTKFGIDHTTLQVDHVGDPHCADPHGQSFTR
jgi:cobalt-zinc-cadmium efflux system protein